MITKKYIQYFKGRKSSKSLWKKPFDPVVTDVPEIKIGNHSVKAGNALLTFPTLK